MKFLRHFFLLISTMRMVTTALPSGFERNRFSDPFLSFILTAAAGFWNKLVLNFILIVAGRDFTSDKKSKRSAIDLDEDYDKHEAFQTQVDYMRGKGNELYSKKVSIFMMVLMTTLLFSTAQGCSSLPLACASQPPPPPACPPPPPPPAACPPPPPPPVACPPPPYPYAPPPPSVTFPPPYPFTTPQPYPFTTPPPYPFTTPPPPSQTDKYDLGDWLINEIKSWNKVMSGIVSALVFFGGLGCCGRCYYRRRQRLRLLEDGEDALSAISDL